MTSDAQPPAIVRTVIAQPYRVTLSKSAAGTHYWEVSVSDSFADDAVKYAIEMDDALRATYLHEVPKEKRESMPRAQTAGGDS